MENPNWADVKAANAAYLAMIASWVAAIATVLAAGFAAVAVWFAKRTAEAAQEQIKVLEDQIALSEPQPIIVIYIGQSSSGLDVENVGDDVAFDVQVGPIGYPAQKAGVRPPTMTFGGLSLLRKGSPHSPEYAIEPESENTIRDAYGQLIPSSVKFFEGLKDQQLDYWYKLSPDSKAAITLATLQVSYKNSRARSFTRSFDVMLKDKRLFVCVPTVSLLHDQKPLHTGSQNV